MKFILEDILVRTDASKQPISLLWRLRPYRITEIDERWCYVGQWWATPALKGQQRLYYRVSCLAPNNVAISMEIYYQRGRWKLSRVLD